MFQWAVTLGKFDIAPPVAVSLPNADVAEKQHFDSVAWVDSQGEIYYGDATASQALHAIKQDAPIAALLLRVDKDTEANRLVRLIATVQAQGVAEVFIEVAK